jgi:hypothetical protein
VAVVLSLWVVILERANENEPRGCCDGLDFESIDICLGLDDGVSESIYLAMIDKGMIIDETVSAWEKRQPKHEDTTAAERKRNQRERERLQKENEELRLQSLSPSPPDIVAPVTIVTACHDVSRSVTTEEIRLEEKRLEENQGQNLNQNSVGYLGGGEAAHEGEVQRIKALHLQTCGPSSLPPLALIRDVLRQGHAPRLIDDVYQAHGGDVMRYRQRNVVEQLTMIRDGVARDPPRSTALLKKSRSEQVSEQGAAAARQFVERMNRREAGRENC